MISSTFSSFNSRNFERSLNGGILPKIIKSGSGSTTKVNHFYISPKAASDVQMHQELFE